MEQCQYNLRTTFPVHASLLEVLEIFEQDLRKKKLLTSSNLVYSLGSIFKTPEGMLFMCKKTKVHESHGTMQPSKLFKQEALCLRTYFGVKSAKQSENSSKRPCGGAKENTSIHTKMSPSLSKVTQKEESNCSKPTKRKKRIRFATSQGNIEFLLSGEKSSGLMNQEKKVIRLYRSRISRHPPGS